MNIENIKELLKKKPLVINMGLRSFYDSLKSQEVIAVHMDWKPPAGGKTRLLKIIKKIH